MCDEETDLKVPSDNAAYNLLDRLNEGLREAMDDFIAKAENEDEAEFYAELICRAARFSAQEWEETPEKG